MNTIWYEYNYNIIWGHSYKFIIILGPNSVSHMYKNCQVPLKCPSFGAWLVEKQWHLSLWVMKIYFKPVSMPQILPTNVPQNPKAPALKNCYKGSGGRHCQAEETCKIFTFHHSCPSKINMIKLWIIVNMLWILYDMVTLLINMQARVLNMIILFFLALIMPRK